MTPPTGYVHAERLAAGVVLIPERSVPGTNVILPRQLVGPGDIATLTSGEAADSDDWKVLTSEPLKLDQPKAPEKKKGDG